MVGSSCVWLVVVVCGWWLLCVAGGGCVYLVVVVCGCKLGWCKWKDSVHSTLEVVHKGHQNLRFESSVGGKGLVVVAVITVSQLICHSSATPLNVLPAPYHLRLHVGNGRLWWIRGRWLFHEMYL